MVVDDDADTLVGADLAHEDAVASGALVAGHRVAPARVRRVGLKVLRLVRRHDTNVLTATEGTDVAGLKGCNGLLKQIRVQVVRGRPEFGDRVRGRVVVGNGGNIEGLASQRVDGEASVIADALRDQRVNRDHRSATEQRRGRNSGAVLVHSDRQGLAGKRNAVNVDVLKERGDLLCNVINEREPHASATVREAGGANRSELIENKFGAKRRVNCKVVRLGDKLRAERDVNNRSRSVVAQGASGGNNLTGRVERRSSRSILVRTGGAGTCGHFLSPNTLR